RGSDRSLERSLAVCAARDDTAIWQWLTNLPRPPERAAGFRSGVLAVFQHLHAIHEDMLHPDGVLVRFLERGAVRDDGRIENNHVGEHSFFHESTMVEAEIRRGQSAQPLHR